MKHIALSDIDGGDNPAGPGLSAAAIMPYDGCLDRPKRVGWHKIACDNTIWLIIGMSLTTRRVLILVSIITSHMTYLRFK